MLPNLNTTISSYVERVVMWRLPETYPEPVIVPKRQLPAHDIYPVTFKASTQGIFWQEAAKLP
jgi:hypothetical protein